MFDFLQPYRSEIYHMASMARSGETLLLKILNSHSQINVVHNLEEKDSSEEEKAFNYLKGYSLKHISRTNKFIKYLNLEKGQVILLKQGVWQHPYSFNGFILSRNPISIYASLKTYDTNHPDFDLEKNFWFENRNRINRWLKDINPSLVNDSGSEKPEEEFCKFYNYRMGSLLNTQLPVIRYEDLVNDPENELEKICKILNLPFEFQILNAHEHYDEGVVGHGKNVLSKPISKKSLNKYKNIVTDKEFEFIARQTKGVYEKYGYKLSDNEILF